MKSSLLLSNITCLDHAVLTTEGICGGSYMVSVEVSGETTSDEHVVVDFGTIKKTLKAIIDDPEHGMDHKLWITDKDLAHSTSSTMEPSLICVPVVGTEAYMIVPRNALHVLRDATSIELSLSLYLQERLRLQYPGVTVDKVHLSTKAVLSYMPGITLDNGPQWTSHPEYFRYAHGLKDSTSWGCQNIAHGHLSYLQLVHRLPTVYKPDHCESMLALSNLAKRISEDLNDTYFVAACNADNDDPYRVSYQSRDRGQFTLELPRNAKVVYLHVETTIEYIVEYVHEVYGQELYDLGVSRIIISEGLTKAAFKDL